MAMALCLVPVKFVPDRDGENVLEHVRTDGRSGRRPARFISDVEIPEIEVDSEDDEARGLRRGLLFLLLVGFFPVAVWLFVHLCYPDLLWIDLTLGSDNGRAASVSQPVP
jgi:hypothetical protein